MDRIPNERGLDYHVYNRGTDKRLVFDNSRDYSRFIHYLYIANDSRPFHLRDAEIPNFKDTDRKMIVDIVAYALMPNHFHLLLRPRVDGGISKFMQKLVTGYTMYFNKKNERSGVLFQGKHKLKLLTDESYLPILIRYIHRNPLELAKNGERGRANLEKEFLRNYRWSSCPDYMGEDNFPSVISPKIFQEVFPTKEDHEDFLFENSDEVEELVSSELLHDHAAPKA